VALLEVRSLERSFGGLRAVGGVSFDAAEGLITAVIGPNGAGKTTLFNCITGTIHPDRGAVSFNGASVFRLPPHRIAARGISRTYQNLKLFTGMSVLENVMVGRHARSRSGTLAGMLRLPGARREERAVREESMRCLELLGIAHLAGADAVSLSFGQQRSVEFARALACGPKLLLLDEPAAGLNIHETAAVARLIQSIRGRGVTVLLVEHDMSLVMDISDHIVVLSNGQVIAQGGPRAIQKNPDVVRVYLGDDHA